MQTGNQAGESIAGSIVLDILNSDFKIPPMPANGLKLMDMVQKPVDEIDLSAFIHLVEPDPGLFSMVLQLANSIYFREQSEILSLRAAIVRVGLQEAVNSVSLYFFRRMLPKIPEIAGFSTKEYWAFSWACATAARRLGHPNLNMNALAGELYIGGLLHGIGKLVLAVHHPAEFSKCVRKARESELPLHRVELDEFGTTDALVASKLMAVWNIPSRICGGVQFHQNPGAAPETCRDIAALIEFACYIAGLSGIGCNGDGVMMPLESTWIAGQTGLPLCREQTRDRIINEVLTAVNERSESVTGVLPQAKQGVSGGQSAVGTNGPAPGTGRLPVKKKGVLGWLKSLVG